MKSTSCLKLLSLLASVQFAMTAPAADSIKPGEIWPDDRGQHIQAHGGGITKVGDTFYWFGEDRTKDLPRERRYVACYSSRDLINWTFRNQVLKLAKPENLAPNWVLERPKVYHNAKTGKFVMYFHLDDTKPGVTNSTTPTYTLAEVGVAVSDTIDGDYQFLKSFRPLGNESRDIGQFVDDDGTAYLISEDRPKGFHIYQLADDYLSIAKDVCLVPQHLESGTIVRFDGLYYFIGSHLTGFDANPNVYATAKSLAGPWSEFKNIAPPETKTYGSQSTFLLKVAGTKATTVIYLGDLWKPRTQWDSRYLWMPLEIGGGQLKLPAPQEWTLDVKTGEANLK